MNKYIDAEKLKADIDKRLSLFEHGIAYDCWASCKKIVNSLQQEQPKADLEKEIDELWKSLNTGHEYVIVRSYQDFLGICLHCFELGLNARKEE